MKEVTIRKVGNQLRIVLPKELIHRQHLKENDKVTIVIL